MDAGWTLVREPWEIGMDVDEGLGMDEGGRSVRGWAGRAEDEGSVRSKDGGRILERCFKRALRAGGKDMIVSMVKVRSFGRRLCYGQ